MLGLFVLREKMRGPRTALAYGSAPNDGRSVYGADQKFSPAAMVLTGGVVVLVGLGLFTVGTAIVKEVTPTIIEATNIKKPLPPPPPEPEVKKAPDVQKPETAVLTPVPDFNIPTKTDFTAKPVEENLIQPLTNDAGTSVVEYVEPLKPADPPKIVDPIMVKVQPDPRYAAKFQPDYPSTMIRMELEGTVNVKVLVGADGRVKQVQVLHATDPAFAKATERQALSSWRFKPATKDGVPYESWYTTKVIFKLNT